MNSSEAKGTLDVGSRNLATSVLVLTVSLVVLAQNLRKVKGVGKDAVPVEHGLGEPVVAPLNEYSALS